MRRRLLTVTALVILALITALGLRAFLPTGGDRAAEPAVSGPGLLQGSSPSDDLLPPDEAFVATARADDEGTIIVTLEASPGYYLYRHKIEVEPVSDGLVLGAPRIPRGDVTEDEFFGEIESLRHMVEVEVPYDAPEGMTEAQIVVRSQGCADIGICYPPQARELTVTLPAPDRRIVSLDAGPPPIDTSPSAPLIPGVDPDTGGDEFDEQRASGFELAPERTAPTGRDVPASPPPAAAEGQDEFARTFASGSMALTATAFFGFGLLLALTPCVFPMVPILSGIIVGHGRQLSTGRAFVLSLAYVMAMAVTYTIAGIVIGLTGSNIQIFLQQPWVIGAFAALFVLLALSMFGLYEIRIPAAVQTRLSAIGGKGKKGTVMGAAVLGFLSALIVSPCITAPLVGALIYIGHTGDALLGGVALFALSLGMGAPLIAFGVSAGRLLPKAGPWMDTVKAVSGFIMLGVAVWMVERVIPATTGLLLWGLLLLFAGIWFGAFDSLGRDATGGARLRKGIAVVLALWGALALAGAAGGGGNLFQPLRGITLGGAEQAEARSLSFRPVKGVAGLEAALANLGGRPAMLDFYADWCVSCKELETYTYTDPDVRGVLDRMVLLKADVTAHDETDRELLAHLGIFGPPALIFYDAQGREREGFRLYGFVPAERFATHARMAAGL